jgi:hypothetical protein
MPSVWSGGRTSPCHTRGGHTASHACEATGSILKRGSESREAWPATTTLCRDTSDARRRITRAELERAFNAGGSLSPSKHQCTQLGGAPSTGNRDLPVPGHAGTMPPVSLEELHRWDFSLPPNQCTLLGVGVPDERAHHHMPYAWCRLCRPFVTGRCLVFLDGEHRRRR